VGRRIDAARVPDTGTLPGGGGAPDAASGFRYPPIPDPLPAPPVTVVTGPADPPVTPVTGPSDPLARELDALRALLDPAVVSVEAFGSEADWLSAKATGIGSSEVAAALGVSRWRSRVSLWLDKVGASDPGADSPAMVWGRRLQRVVADGYIEETGRELVDPGPYVLLRSVRYPFLIATPDYFVRARALRPDPGLLEIKTASAYARGDWRDEPPLPYLLQVQAQLLVSGLAWAALAALIGGQELVYTDVAPHDGARDWLVEELAAFWALVQSETPPRPLDGSEATTTALRRLYRTTDPGKAIRLPDAARAWDEIIVAGEAQIKTLAAEVEAAKNELRVAMGDAEIAELEGRVTWTNKVETRKGYTRVVDPWSGRVLRRRAPRGDDGKG
jgi:putative phage-type endonuclease